MCLTSKEFDVIVIGAGGAGMRTALQISQQGLSCALISKVFPTRSHTVSAQGGITVSLGNAHKDNWHWHMYDTVKGSDYIGDQDAIEYMCRNGPKAIIELEHMGMPFSRFENGSIYQRSFGGQSVRYGESQASRTASVADRTGHALLHTLYQQNIKNKTNFFSEWYSIDLVKNQDNRIVGCVALCITNGDIVYFKAKATVLATGGAGRIYQSTTNAYINTGDGIGMVLRAGMPVQDMEMWQFHPTGIAGLGILITEGCRGEGGYLLNNKNERFMCNYAPKTRDLASRDVVSRAIMTEIRNGNGYYSDTLGSYVNLKISHLGSEILMNKLPGIIDLSRTFAKVDPLKDSIPVIPTCHYMMGGIPTTIYGQVVTLDEQGKDIIVPGLFAVGEVACVSVHGANRLGGNSLLDIIVFGRAIGLSINKLIKNYDDFREASKEDIDFALRRYKKWNNKKNYENPAKIRKSLQKYMQDYFSVFRKEEDMKKGLKKIKDLKNRLKYASLKDYSKFFNTQRIECLELDNLIETAYATAVSAIFRKESRGAHNRIDFPNRDDKKWLCHTIFFSKNERILRREVNLTPKFCNQFKPQSRTY